MRHRKKGRKLNRNFEHRRSLLANLAGALVQREQIITTLAKAKMLRPYIEKLVTMARRDTLHTRRLIHAKLHKEWATKLCNVLSVRYRTRPGGYVRVLKADFRAGDSAPMALIEFIDRDTSAKGSGISGVSSVNDETKDKDVASSSSSSSDSKKNVLST